MSSETEAKQRGGWLRRLRQGLSRSAQSLSGGITSIISKRRLDDEALEELEELLIAADLGASTAAKVTAGLARTRFDQEVSSEEVRGALAAEIEKILEPVAVPLELDPAKKPFVILVVGVNGTGKTTTIGKLARHFRDDGRSVLLAAGDTFRAAAIEQLQIWGERTGAPVVARETGADAAGLVYDALNKADLMAELTKVIRVIRKQDPEAPHATLLILDATTGQNAHRQVEIFQEMAGVTGLVVTKLDGTARGGVVVSLAERFGLPIHAVGVGETADDLRPFSARAFARNLMGLEAEQ